MTTLQNLDFECDEPACEPAAATNFTWWQPPTTADEWAAFDAMFDAAITNPPRGGWMSLEETRRLNLLVTAPWLFGMGTSKVHGAVGVGAAWCSGLITSICTKTRRGRRDQGVRRPSLKPATPHPAPWTLDVPIPAPAYLPEGLLEALPPYALPTFKAAAIDICDRLAANEGDKFRPMSYEAGRERYGRVRTPDAAQVGADERPIVWGVVINQLEQLNIIEHRLNPDGTPRFRVGRLVNGKKVGGQSMSYRLTERWRRVLGQVRVERDASLWVPPMEAKPLTTLSAAVEEHTQRRGLDEPEHYRRCRGLVRFDLVSALLFLCQRYGATRPDGVDFGSFVEAFKVADVPQAILRKCKPKPPKKRPLVVGDRVVVRRMDGEGKLVGFTSDCVVVEVAGVRKTVGKSRVRLLGQTALELARVKALHRLKFIWRWQVDGREWAHRDSAGHRLHNAVTALPKDLRQFLTYDGIGEELVQIDACNSQMAILASMAAKKVGMKGDIVDVVECCAAGLFYERTFVLVHGHPPDEDERNLHKRAVMASYIYAARDEMLKSELGKALASAWPRFTAFLMREKTNVSVLPCRAQQVEADLWIDRLAPELAARDIPAQPVHDSVIVPRSRAVEVVDVLQQLHAEAGIRIKLRIEPSGG